MKPSHIVSLSLTLTLASSAAHAQFGGQGRGGGGQNTTAATTPPAWAKFGLNPKVRVNLDFRNASIDAVLHVLSQASGVAIIKDPSLVGGITLQSPRPQSLDQAFTILNAVLNLKNYEIASEGGFLLVRPRQGGGQGGGRSGGGRGGFGGGGFGGRRGGQSELRTYVLRYADATELARVINDVFAAPANGQGGAAFAVVGGNPNGGGGGNGGNGGGGGNGGNGGGGGNNGGGFGGGRGGRRGGFGGGNGGGGGNNGGGFGGGGGQDTSSIPVKASADSYSNSLIINAGSAQQSQIADIIDQIDRPTDQPQRARVFQLSYALASDLQPVIQNVLSGTPTTGRGASTANNRQGGGGRGGFGGGGGGGFGGFFNRFGGGGGGGANNANGTVTAETRTNTLVVTATAAVVDEVSLVIQQLDKPTNFESTTFVYVLKNARADVIANLLNESFGNRTTNGPVGGSLTNPTFASGTLASGGSSAPGGLAATTAQRNTTTQTVTSGQQNQTPATTGVNSEGQIINIRNLTGQVLLVPNIDTNSIIVVAPPEDKQLVEAILDTLDRIPEQVMIETLVVETNLTKANQLGVEFNFRGLGGGGSQLFGLGSLNPPNLTGVTAAGTPAAAPGGGLRYSLTAGQYQAVLTAIQTDTAFNVLSTPRIFTTNNATAQINISQSIPYQTSNTITAGTSTTSVSFLDVGIVLTVTPRITSGGYVTMDVTQTANDFVGYAPGLNAPIVNQRETQTTVSVKDGETVVLGGLINNSVNRTVNKVPLLGDIPLIGNLFRSTNVTKAKTELLVFMTPHVVQTAQDAERLRAQTVDQLGKTARTMLPAVTNAATPDVGSYRTFTPGRATSPGTLPAPITRVTVTPDINAPAVAIGPNANTGNAGAPITVVPRQAPSGTTAPGTTGPNTTGLNGGAGTSTNAPVTGNTAPIGTGVPAGPAPGASSSGTVAPGPAPAPPQ